MLLPRSLQLGGLFMELYFSGHLVKCDPTVGTPLRRGMRELQATDPYLLQNTTVT